MQAGLLFFIAVFWGFFPVFTAIFTFPQERAMLNKERAVDMYRLSAYFMARTTSDLPLDLFLPIIFLLIVYFMAALRQSVEAFFLTMLIVFLSIVAAQVCRTKNSIFLEAASVICHQGVGYIEFIFCAGTRIGNRSLTNGRQEGNYFSFSYSNDLYARWWIFCEGKGYFMLYRRIS